jgi:hypothetical protein
MSALESSEHGEQQYDDRRDFRKKMLEGPNFFLLVRVDSKTFEPCEEKFS